MMPSALVRDVLPPHLHTTGLESHSGMLSGPQAPGDPSPSWTRWRREAVSAREVLETVLAELLRAGPVTVKFSGGRDSSLVLAVAVHVARREGLPLPAAVTVRYPGNEDADEASWQDLVVRHLGIPLQVVSVPHGADDLAGPFAASRLERDGPLPLPPTGVALGRIAALTTGQTVVSGEGGDAVLELQRITYWVAHLRRRRVPGPAMARRMAVELLPAPARRHLVQRAMLRSGTASWLRPSARQQVLAAAARDLTDERWDWRQATWQFLGSRMWALAQATQAEVARREGFELVHPLLDPRFVEALCRQAGRAGLTSRTEAMRLLASDLLPEPVLTRRTKATFNGVYSSDATRAFARSWDGRGVDHDLVDPEALRRVWGADRVTNAALAPLQLALHATLLDHTVSATSS